MTTINSFVALLNLAAIPGTGGTDTVNASDTQVLLRNISTIPENIAGATITVDSVAPGSIVTIAGNNFSAGETASFGFVPGNEAAALEDLTQNFPIDVPIQAQTGSTAVLSITYYAKDIGPITGDPELNLISATVETEEPDQIVFTYSSPLDTGSVPAAADFTASNKTIADVLVSGSTVIIVVDSPYIDGDEIIVSYTPGVTPITGVNAVVASALTDQVVTNNIAPVTTPAAVATALVDALPIEATNNIRQSVSVLYSSDAGINMDSITDTSLTAVDGSTAAAVTLVDKFSSANGIIARYGVTMPSSGNYTLTAVSSEISDNDGAVGTDTPLGSVISSARPTVRFDAASTDFPKLTTPDLGSNIPLQLIFEHPNGIDATTVDANTIEVRDIDNNVRGVTGLTGTTALSATELQADFTLRLDNGGQFDIFVVSNGFTATSGEQVARTRVGGFSGSITPPVFPRVCPVHWFVDDVAKLMFNQFAGYISRYDGEQVLAQQPLASNLRGNCLKLTCSTNLGASSYYYWGVRGIGVGTRTNPFQGSFVQTARIQHVIRVMIAKRPASAEIELARLVVNGGDAPQFRLSASGELVLYSGQTLAASTGFTPAANQWFEINFDCNPSARNMIARWRLPGGMWNEFYNNGNHFTSTTRNMSGIQLGIVNCYANTGEPVEVWLDKISSGANEVDQIDGDANRGWYLLGSGCRDATDTEAKLSAVYPDGLFRNGAAVRVQYSLDSTFASGVITTPKKSVFIATHHNTTFDLSGLTPGTNYYYRFQVLNVSDQVIYETENYRFYTLPTDNSEISTLISSCVNEGAYLRPYTSLRPVGDIAEAETNYYGFMGLGDFGYADAFTGGSPPDIHKTAAYTTEMFEATIRQTAHDLWMERLFRFGVLNTMADDHNTTQNADARIAPGGPLANEAPTDTFLNPDNYVYPAGVTLEQLWVRGLEVYDAWFGDNYLDNAGPGLKYGTRLFGHTRFVRIDTRIDRRPDLGIYVGATQETWLKNVITAFGSSPIEKVMHILTNASWTDQGSKISEGWRNFDQVGWEEIQQHIYDNVPSSKRIVIHRGDDHLGYAGTTHSYRDGSEIVAQPPYVGEFVWSGIAENFHDYPIPATYRVFQYSNPSVSEGELIRVTGGFIRMKPTEVTAQSWDSTVESLPETTLFSIP